MATSDAPLSVPNITLAVARQAGGNPVSGFSAQSGFAVSDNGDGTLSVTDSQSRFGVKPNAAKPVWFFDFGSGSDQPHPTLSRNQTTLVWAAECVPNQVVTKTGSDWSLTIDKTSGVTSVFTSGDDSLFLNSNTGRKYFRYYDVYNDFTYTELADGVNAATGGATSFENLKHHRWQSANAQTTPYTGTDMQAASYAFNWFNTAASVEFYKANTELSTKRWRAEEEYHQVSSAAGATDAIAYGVVNGKQKFIRADQDSHDGLDPSDPAYEWDHYKLASFQTWAAPGDAPWRANLLYVDDSWCRLYITDKPTWSDAETKLMEIQVPVSWASGQVNFHFRSGQFSSLTGKYLWVVDNDDTKILIGGWS